jgi:hypothetical protein
MIPFSTSREANPGSISTGPRKNWIGDYWLRRDFTRASRQSPMWKPAANRLLGWPPPLRLLDIEGLLRLISENTRRRLFDWVIAAQAMRP